MSVFPITTMHANDNKEVRLQVANVGSLKGFLPACRKSPKLVKTIVLILGGLVNAFLQGVFIGIFRGNAV